MGRRKKKQRRGNPWQQKQKRARRRAERTASRKASSTQTIQQAPTLAQAWLIDRTVRIPGIDLRDPEVEAVIRYVLARGCQRFGVRLIQVAILQQRLRVAAL